MITDGRVFRMADRCWMQVSTDPDLSNDKLHTEIWKLAYRRLPESVV